MDSIGGSCTTALAISPAANGFRLELKSWEALRWLRDTALALASGAPRPLDYRGDALHYYHNAMIGDTHLEVVDCDSRVYQIAVSAHDDCGSHYGPGSVCITGLEFFFENGPPASLGYTSPGATNIPRKKWRNSQRTKMAHPRVRVMMDLIDFKGIMMTHNLDGVSGLLILQSLDEEREARRKRRRCCVGERDYPYYVYQSLRTSSLEQVSQVVAVFNVSI